MSPAGRWCNISLSKSIDSFLPWVRDAKCLYHAKHLTQRKYKHHFAIVGPRETDTKETCTTQTWHLEFTKTEWMDFFLAYILVK